MHPSRGTRRIRRAVRAAAAASPIWSAPAAPACTTASLRTERRDQSNANGRAHCPAIWHLRVGHSIGGSLGSASVSVAALVPSLATLFNGWLARQRGRFALL